MYFVIKFFQKISAINRTCSYNINIFKIIIYPFSGSFFIKFKNQIAIINDISGT